jgi:hypothetical protein
MKKLKFILYAMVVAFAAFMPAAAHAQDINTVMEMITQELNKSVADEPDIDGAVWDAENSAFVVIMAQSVTEGLDLNVVDADVFKALVVPQVVAGDKESVTQLIDLFSEMGVRFVIRLTSATGDTLDFDITKEDLE